MIAANQQTLAPAPGQSTGGLPDAGCGDDRLLLTYAGGHAPVLTDQWQPAALNDGRTVFVRRADCGAGCRCAGEFAWELPGWIAPVHRLDQILDFLHDPEQSPLPFPLLPEQDTDLDRSARAQFCDDLESLRAHLSGGNT